LVLAVSALLLTLFVLFCMDGLITALLSLLAKRDPLGLNDQAPCGFHSQLGQPNLFLQVDDQGG
jgi:hypothetical protein